MKIKFFGVRGSFPVPGEKTNKYGGNTSCVCFTKESDGKIYRLIIDCGSGAIKLGKDIVKNYFQKKEDLEIVMLFTHLHPDHTQAFPFFAPNYFKDCSIHLMGMKTLKKHVGTVLEQSMLPPSFPIEYKDLKSKRKHYELNDGAKITIPMSKNSDPVFIVDVMQSYAPSHPQQGAIYYRVTDPISGKSVACIWDLESKQGGDKAVINFSKNCDIMVHDTQYTQEEYENCERVVQGFGHSTYKMAIDNAKQSGVKQKLICTHFNPEHSDDKLDDIQNQIDECENNDSEFQFQTILAREGMEIEL